MRSSSSGSVTFEQFIQVDEPHCGKKAHGRADKDRYAVSDEHGVSLHVLQTWGPLIVMPILVKDGLMNL